MHGRGMGGGSTGYWPRKAGRAAGELEGTKGEAIGGRRGRGRHKREARRQKRTGELKKGPKACRDDSQEGSGARRGSSIEVMFA